MKVVINKCFGGFGLSQKAYARLIELGIPLVECTDGEDPEPSIYESKPGDMGYGGLREKYWDCWTRHVRSNPLLIQVVEELGAEASGPLADLKIVEIPDGIEYEIDEYDGIEHIAEVHRTWG